MTRTIVLAASFAAFLVSSLLTGSPAAAQAGKPPHTDQNNVRAANQAAIRGADDAALVGALHEFAYERGALYAIQASPARITDLALEPGETLLSVSAGDTTRWIVGDARSGAGPSSQAHVLVKPNAAGLATNLVIMTDRRVYHVELRSVGGPAMAAVSWRYPADIRLASVSALVGTPSAFPLPSDPGAPVFEPASINLRYRISGDKPAWRPLAAFDNGRQVFIEMPPAIELLEAPPLFVIGEDGAELVNYRVQGRYYVVDRLFMRAELRLGGKNKRAVRIERLTPVAAQQPGGGHG